MTCVFFKKEIMSLEFFRLRLRGDLSRSRVQQVHQALSRRFHDFDDIAIDTFQDAWAVYHKFTALQVWSASPSLKKKLDAFRAPAACLPLKKRRRWKYGNEDESDDDDVDDDGASAWVLSEHRLLPPRRKNTKLNVAATKPQAMKAKKTFNMHAYCSAASAKACEASKTFKASKAFEATPPAKKKKIFDMRGYCTLNNSNIKKPSPSLILEGRDSGDDGRRH